jgi:hypothetical protein
MISALTKDPLLLSYRQKMEGYSEAILHKIGQRKREVIVIMEMQMITLGYFLFTIKLNSKFNSKKNNMRYATVTSI